MIEFIRFGTIGDLRLGVSRASIMDRLGPPGNWVGKPPTFGPQVHSPDQADIWFYYGDAAGIEFDSSGRSVTTSVHPSKIDKQLDVFRAWPIGPGATVLDFRTILLENRISFVEDNEAPEMYYLLAEQRCYIICPPCKDGKLTPIEDRELSMIITVAKETDLPGFIPASKEAQ
jgi:hypothetical protein